ncbi:MAG: NAD(P) transhydrogenase subunit alpha [Alphaproteobacteria bacterium]|nr:MAG: NAD(P) transhydrogenase subunit alpha [Alphaproteobacteria bacterium]
MIVATVKEKNEFENRVSITPDTCKSYIKAGLDVIIEKNAGYNASFLDSVYKESGAKVLDREQVLQKADILVSVSSILENSDLEILKNKAVIIGGFNPYENSDKIQKIIGKNLSLISLDFLPRISRAQSMDILSSQANLAGYKAVIEASSIFKKALPMMMTAAGTIIPAKCLILGAGVAGLQAIATAKRLGCVVSAFDVRPEVEEQVNSLGAKFVKVEDGENTKETQTVYAKEMSEDYKKKQLKAIHDVAINMDIIISTALIPGKKAPLLIESNTISQMKSGSILIDLASSSGGNIEGSKIGEKVNINDCVVYAPRNLPSLIAYDASLLFSKNIYNFISNFITENKIFDIEAKDELLLKTILVKNGNKTENFYDG